MFLVSEENIPKPADVVDVPLHDMSAVLRTCILMTALCENEGGIGLAAVQVGLPWRLFIVKAIRHNLLIGPAGEYGYFINCDYFPGVPETKTVSLEGCLSIRSPEGYLRHFEVQRYKKIHLLGKQLKIHDDVELVDVETDIDMDGQSIVFQHEIDHQRGVLISDIGKEVILW